MHTEIAYFDETGDDGIIDSSSDFFVLTSLYMATEDWQDNFDAMKACRKNLKDGFGFHITEEMHTKHFLTDKGLYRPYGWTKEQKQEILKNYTKAISRPKAKSINVFVSFAVHFTKISTNLPKANDFNAFST